MWWVAAAHRIEHGYPTPSLGRDAVLEKALPWLQQYNIWSRGRFGSYKVRLRIGTEGGGQCRPLSFAACMWRTDLAARGA